MQLAAQRRKHSNLDHYVCHKPMVERDAEFNSRAAAVVEPAAISRAAQCADASVTR